MCNWLASFFAFINQKAAGNCAHRATDSHDDDDDDGVVVVLVVMVAKTEVEFKLSLKA